MDSQFSPKRCGASIGYATIATMTRRLPFAALVVSGLLGATPADAQVNVTGTWQPKTWTLRISLRQEGNRVWGFGGQKDFWFRGQWDGDRLVLVANNFEEKRRTCASRAPSSR